MKAAVLNKTNGLFDIENIEIGTPLAHEVLVQVKASGLCHSDLHIAENDFGIPLPAVLGHELSGIVVAIGADVRGFSAGDHVVGSLLGFCGHCQSCIGGRTFFCDHPEENLRTADQAPRLSRDGQPVTAFYGTAAFAEYALVHENQLVVVPKAIPFPQASILGCATVTGAGAILNTAAVKTGETVAIMGIGGVGLNVISGAVLAGASRIIAIDTQPKKKALALKFGATDFINASEVDVPEAVLALTNGAGVDHVFEVIGLKSTSEQALHLVRRGGSVYLIGVHKPGSFITTDVSLNFIRKAATIKGVYMGSSSIKRDIPIYAELYLQGRLNLDDLISREINLADINTAYQELKDGAIARCVITSF